MKHTKKDLIDVIQQAIVLYIAQEEKAAYCSDFIYDLEEILESPLISWRRRKNIKHIDGFFHKPSIKTDIELAEAVYEYLENIYTGFNIFWLIPVRTGNSAMKTSIHHAMFRYDAELFEACQRGTTKQLAWKRKQAKPALDLAQINKMTVKDLLKLNTELQVENANLRMQLRRAEVALNQSKTEKSILLGQLQQSLASNEILRNKVEKMIKMKSPKSLDTTIELKNLAH